MESRMAAMLNIKTVFIFVLSIFATVSVCRSARLSDPKILLPYHSSVIVNFTLQINLTKDESKSPSCYTWRSSRLDVATVQLINSTDNECALSAEISAVAKSSLRKTSIVIAENKVSGEILKCIVLVDMVHRIEIETTTRLLYLEDSPEELMVRGYDAEGNVFSSLRGLEFQWSLHSDTTGDHDTVIDANSILRILKFMESHYTTPHGIERLEERGRQGDIILLEGVRTGSAIIWAKLRDPAYELVGHSTVKLMVIANLMVSPPEAYVLKYATVNYRVEQIRQNSVVEIKMPSSQFYLQVQDDLIASLDASSSIATAQELGETEIKLIDKNIKTSDILGQPSAILHVVNPSYLAFVVLPDRKWVLETGRLYEVLIEVYDKNSHKLHPSDNVIVTALFPSTYFKVLHSTKNGTYHHVRTLQKGDSEIDGELSTIIRDDGSEFTVTPSLKQTQFVEIFDPITVQPELLFFPWDPVQESRHKYPLKAMGGSGEYVWTSDNTDVITVNKNGEITTFSQGQVRVTAADKRNQLHHGSAQVHVLPPTDMEFKPSRVEVVVGSTLDLPLDVMATYRGVKYSFRDCRSMPLNVTFTDPSVVEYVDGVLGFSMLMEGSCRTVKVKALQQGHTKVKATYQHGGVSLESTVTIAAYDPLEPIDPVREAVVTVGASKEVVFSGGPQPWLLDSSKYFQQLTASKSKNVVIHPVKTQRGFHSLFVTCKDFGEQTLTLRVGNEKTAKNIYPAVEDAVVTFVCAEPVEIHLTPQIDYPKNLPPCPVAREPNVPIPAHCQRDLNLLVTVTDAHGRRFDNVSSLEFDWQLSDSGLASLVGGEELETEITVTSSGRKTVANYVTLQPMGIPDTLVVTVGVSKYKRSYLRFAQSDISERISPKISKSVELRLVEEAVISPAALSVFNHPSNKVKVNIERGSGYFHIMEGRAGIVELAYAEKRKQIQMVPAKDGQLTVTCYDLCIDSIHPATTTVTVAGVGSDASTCAVTVAGVGSVHLYTMDKVEVGKDITARVRVLDATGEKLFSSFFPLMALKLEPASDFISVKPDLDNTLDDYTATYTIHGAIVGHTSLRAITHLPSGQRISSDPKPVEVFPPLELFPRNITLIIGALFQVLSRGGPRPQCTVVFSIRSSEIATVSGSGLLDAQSLGTTRVVGQAVGQDPETGETVIYSQDEVAVNVVKLAGVRIHAPLTRLQTETTMPLYAVGLTEHETPFTFGSAVPPLSFKWTVNKKDVAQLQSVFYKSGIQPQHDGNFAVQMVAMETGHVSVRLEVMPQRGHKQIVNDAVLADELQIQVFTQLAMISPRVCDGELLMTPNTDAPLKTNRDGAAKMTYTVMSTDHASDIVTVTDDGTLQSGSTTGQAALHITAQEEFGTNQTVVILVKVKPVSYMMVNSDTALMTSSGQLTTVPRGTTLHFTVTYHDDVGEPFYATNVQMKYRCSRYDLVQVTHGSENNTLVMKTAAVGHTILKVWDSNKPWLTDYIGIPVGYAIEPAQARLPLGGIACFQTPILSSKGQPGVWQGTSGLSLSTSLGLGTAVSVGGATVSYSVTDAISTETEVYIEPIKELSLDAASKFITTVTSDHDGYTYFIKMGTLPIVLGENCSAVIAEQNYQPARIPVICQLRFESPIQDISLDELFTVTAVFVAKSGRYACQVTPLTHGQRHPVSVLNTKLVLEARVLSSKGQGEVGTPLVPLTFLPPLFLHNMEVHLSTLTPLSSVRISTIPSLIDTIQVVVSDPSILEALRSERDPQSGSIVIYPIRLLDTISLWEREQLDVWVDLICQKTGQKVKVPVYIRLIGQKPDLSGIQYGRQAGWRALFGSILNNYQYWFILAVIILVTAATVLFGWHAIYGPRYKAAAVANTSGFASPGLMPGMMSPSGAAPAYPYPYSTGASTPYSPMYPSQTPKTPLLWSTGYTPIDGSSPTRRRSPIQRISPS